MAKRKQNKIQPAELTFPFIVSIPGADPSDPSSPGVYTDVFIDLSQVASLMNRRFYRQGLNWAVKDFKFLSTPGITGEIACSKVPTTWVMSNAWEKSFRAWQHMIKNATDESGAQSIQGKFLDFKLYANAEHHALGFDANLLPYADSAPVATRGLWEPALISIPQTPIEAQPFPADSIYYELVAVGRNDPGAGASGLDAKSVIQGYADSRALPSITDPNVPADASTNWMLGLFAEGNDQDSDVVQMLEIVGDQPPYPFENDGTNPDTMYPGGETQLAGLAVHDWDKITGTTIGGVTYLKGGNFPCGLVRLQFTNFNVGNQLLLNITMVPGHHRGYLCEPMTEM